jgi:hypothetical protein
MLAAQLAALSESIDINKISQDDFKDIFDNTLNDVMRNRSLEKKH